MLCDSAGTFQTDGFCIFQSKSGKSTAFRSRTSAYFCRCTWFLPPPDADSGTRVLQHFYRPQTVYILPGNKYYSAKKPWLSAARIRLRKRWFSSPGLLRKSGLLEFWRGGFFLLFFFSHNFVFFFFFSKNFLLFFFFFLLFLKQKKTKNTKNFSGKKKGEKKTPRQNSKSPD